MTKRLGVIILVAFAVILVMVSMEGSAKQPPPPTPPPYPDLTGTTWRRTFQCTTWDMATNQLPHPPGFNDVVFFSDAWILYHNVSTGNFYGWVGPGVQQSPITGNISTSTWAFTAIQQDTAFAYLVYTGTLHSDGTYTYVSGTYNHYKTDKIPACKFSLNPN